MTTVSARALVQQFFVDVLNQHDEVSHFEATCADVWQGLDALFEHIGPLDGQKDHPHAARVERVE
jgi:hypothetical protein